MKRKCSIDGCDSPHRSRGFCSRHYQRWLANGDPFYQRPLRPIADRFNEKLRKRTDGCWIWTGRRGQGYGLLKINGKAVGAHRVSWELAFGSIPDGMNVLQRCLNRACVRPDHLYLSKNTAPGDAMLENPTSRSSVRSALLRRHSKSRCESCGCRQKLDIHHVDGDWKNNSADNLQVLCHSCHMKLHWRQGDFDAGNREERDLRA